MSLRLRIFLAFALLALLPALPVTWAVRDLIDKSFEVGLSPEVQKGLDGGADAARRWLRDERYDFRARVDMLALRARGPVLLLLDDVEHLVEPVARAVSVWMEQTGTLRLLGDPGVRYREDPVRMLRAVRFAAKLGFRIDPGCEQPLFEEGDMIRNVPPARLFDEVLKLFMGGTALQCFEKLRHYQLFGHLFPETEESLSHEEQDFPIDFDSGKTIFTESLE